jgi:hypothetical protein
LQCRHNTSMKAVTGAISRDGEIVIGFVVNRF